MDKIDNAIQITKYLRLRLFKRIKREKYLNYIIYTFIANFIIISKTKFLANLILSKTQIEICIEYKDMGIILCNIYYIIQFIIKT